MPETKPCPEAHRRLIDRLRIQASDVHRLTEGLHENHLAKRVVPDRWSLKELVCHVQRVQQIFIHDRLDAMLTNDNPELVAYYPEDDPLFEKMLATPADESIAAFLEERQRLIARLEKLTLEEWHRPGRHPVYSQSDVYSLAEYCVHHEAHHIYQMFQRRALIGRIPG
jgi:hypothetical protein